MRRSCALHAPRLRRVVFAAGAPLPFAVTDFAALRAVRLAAWTGCVDEPFVARSDLRRSAFSTRSACSMRSSASTAVGGSGGGSGIGSTVAAGAAAASRRARCSARLSLLPRGTLAITAAPVAELVAMGAAQQTLLVAVAHHAEIDLAAVQVDTADLHPHARAGGVADAGAFAAELLADLVERKYSPPSSVMWIRPSTYSASSVTNRPKLVTALTVPAYSSPRCSRMKRHFSQASTSREASSARRSFALQCAPMTSQCSASVDAAAGLGAFEAGLPAAWASVRGVHLGCRARTSSIRAAP